MCCSNAIFLGSMAAGTSYDNNSNMVFLMSDADVILKIKETEKKADLLESQALKKKEKKIEKARSIASGWLEDAKKEADKKEKKKISDARKRIKKKRDAMVEKSRKEADRMRSDARKRIPKAADYVVSDFISIVSKE